MASQIELISFKTCPFVQRAVIMAIEKQAPHKITYIERNPKPDWFLEISPHGKVPVVRIGDAVLFESAPICEYIDEASPPSIMPADAVARAFNRAWILHATTLMLALGGYFFAAEEEAMLSKVKPLAEALAKTEGALEDSGNDGPFFNGEAFSVIDASFAPAFQRYEILERYRPLGLLADLPRVAAWSKALLAHPSVKTSVVADFDRLFRDSQRARGSFIAGFFPEEAAPAAP